MQHVFGVAGEQRRRIAVWQGLVKRQKGRSRNIVGIGASAGGRKVREKEVSWYSLRARPNFTVNNKVGGAVLVVNITNLNESSRP
jgi:hypothetical protein